MPQKPTRPRIPLPAAAEIIGDKQTIQVNHCRMPDCVNFGVPALHEGVKRGPSPLHKDPHYNIDTTGSGEPAIRCKSCNTHPPLKSNAAIADEIKRLVDMSGILTSEESTACRNPQCENSARPIALNRSCYHKKGIVRGRGQQYRCKACGRYVLLSDPVRLHKNHQASAVDVFSRVANKSAVRRTVHGAGLKSNRDYYRVLDFIYSRCRALSGAYDRSLIDGRLTLPAAINVHADAQEYKLNWVSRLDRRNVELQAYCSVDRRSGFVFGLHANFDPTVDPFAINSEAAISGEMDVPEAFRKYARYWLVGDELRAGRSMKHNVAHSNDLSAQIQSMYAEAAARKDVEDIELHHFDETYQTPTLKGGLQVHMPYTTYAHWFLLRRILKGAGVEKIQVNLDIDSMSRAGFLCAFADEVKKGDAHLFFVRYRKDMTVDERRRVLRQSKRALRAFAKTLPPEIQDDPVEVRRRMMLEALEHGNQYGQWKDEWFKHPLPAMNEPEKVVAWMTRDDALDEVRVADMFLQAGLTHSDNAFQKVRRLNQSLERPISTPSGLRTNWDGYAPYKPEIVQKYLTIFRAVNNFVFIGRKDRRTPAMRLGFAKQPLEWADILWPGQGVPQLKRSRRRGKKLFAA